MSVVIESVVNQPWARKWKLYVQISFLPPPSKTRPNSVHWGGWRDWTYIVGLWPWRQGAALGQTPLKSAPTARPAQSLGMVLCPLLRALATHFVPQRVEPREARMLPYLCSNWKKVPQATASAVWLSPSVLVLSPIYGELTMNGVGFVISKEDITSGPGTRLEHSRAFI